MQTPGTYNPEKLRSLFGDQSAKPGLEIDPAAKSNHSTQLKIVEVAEVAKPKPEMTGQQALI